MKNVIQERELSKHSPQRLRSTKPTKVKIETVVDNDTRAVYEHYRNYR